MHNTFLYTLPQWFIFASIFVTVYGWVENKKAFRIIGAAIFILLGIYAFIILQGDYFSAANFLTPDEIAREELDDEIINEIPFEASLFPAYLSFIFSALFAIPAIYFDYKSKRKYQLFIVISGLIALFGFFIIVGALKSL
jgi:hypothetical protein